MYTRSVGIHYTEVLDQVGQRPKSDGSTGKAQPARSAAACRPAAVKETGLTTNNMQPCVRGAASAVHPGFPLASAQYEVAEEMSAPVKQFTHLRVAARVVRGRLPALH